jgi:DNA polymerase-3 subunit epsilon
MWPFGRGAAAPADRLAQLAPAEARYVVLDTELTGLDERRDAIVSIGALRMVAGRIVLAERFYREVRPECALTPASIVVHGITPDEVRGLPEIAAPLAEFAAFCGDDVLVGHFVGIDLGFLRTALARAALPPLANPALDTWPLYQWLAGRGPAGGPGLPRLQDPRLPALAAALGVPRCSRHNALGDAFVTAQVFQRLLRRLDRWGVATARELLRIGDVTRSPDHTPHDSPPLT